MKIPLDHICVRSGILCPRCQKLVNSGVVSHLDVELMKAMLELEDTSEFRILKNVEYKRSIKADEFVVVIIDSGGSLSKSHLIRLSRILSEKLSMRIRVIDSASSDVKSLILQVIAPARLFGVNTLWLPDGTTQYIVRISKYDVRHLPTKREVLENILTQMLGMQVRIRAE